MGYTRQSRRQLQALIRAARDPDSEVRNSATRALGVLVRSKPALAREIPAAPFIDMLNSGIWSDRNKSVALIAEMTVARDPALFAALRAEAFDSLVEMAQWRTGHALFARMILGRIAGIPEEQLLERLMTAPPQTIIDAATRSRP